MSTNNIVNVQDSSALRNALVDKLTGKLPVSNDSLDNILTWGSAELSNLDTASREIITSTMASLVTKQEVVGPYVPENDINMIKTYGSYDSHDGVVQRLRLSIPDAESDMDTYDPDTTGNTAQALFGKKPISISTRYWFKPFAHRYSWTEGSRWFTGLLLKGHTINEIYSMMKTQVDNAQRLEQKAETLAMLRSSMMMNLASVTDISDVGNARAVNLLAKYNSEYGTTLTAEAAINTPEFLRYAGRVFEVTERKMREVTTMYNEMEFRTGAAQTAGYFNAEFVSAYKRNMLVDAFNVNLGSLVSNQEVVWWKGPKNASNEVDFATATTINDTITVDWETNPITVNMPYVLGTIIDTERLGLYNWGVENTEQKDASALSTNMFSHVYGSALCDPYYNAVTFYIA